MENNESQKKYLCPKCNGELKEDDFLCARCGRITDQPVWDGIPGIEGAILAVALVVGIPIALVVSVMQIRAWLKTSGVQDVRVAVGSSTSASAGTSRAIFLIMGIAVVSCAFIFWISRRRRK